MRPVTGAILRKSEKSETIQTEVSKTVIVNQARWQKSNMSTKSTIPENRHYNSVEDPNRLRLDPDLDPGSHVHSDPDPATEPNKILINLNPDPALLYQKNFKINALS